MKVYVTRQWNGEYFLTPEYDRVEYYDHIEICKEQVQGSHRSDLNRFGFAVATPNRFYTDTIYLNDLWSNGPVIQAKPYKPYEQTVCEAYTSLLGTDIPSCCNIEDDDSVWRQLKRLVRDDWRKVRLS